MQSGRQNTTSSTDALIGLLEAAPILAKLEAREIDALATLDIIENNFAADAIIIEQGARVRSIHLVRSGSGLHLPPIFPAANARSSTFRCAAILWVCGPPMAIATTTIAAITPMSIFEIPLNSLENAIKHAPRLSFHPD